MFMSEEEGPGPVGRKEKSKPVAVRQPTFGVGNLTGAGERQIGTRKHCPEIAD